MLSGEVIVGQVEELHPTFFKKLEEHVTDAIEKFRRVRARTAWLHLNVSLDTPVSFDDDAHSLVEQMAKSHCREHSMGLVLVRHYDWRKPWAVMESD